MESLASRAACARVLGAALTLTILALPAQSQEPYREPPQAVVDILDAPALPNVSVSPDREWLLFLDRTSMPSIAELAEPILRIAGTRINPANNANSFIPRTIGLRLKRIENGAEHAIALPAGVRIGATMWSPDGSKLAFTRTLDDRVELWAADVATGAARMVVDAQLNAVGSSPCKWLADNVTMLCAFVPDNRGAAPEAPRVPSGPTVEESSGRPGIVRTYQDLLSNAHDVALFDHYFTAQLAYVNSETGARTNLGQPGIFNDFEPSPNGEFVLVQRVVPPYSYQVPMSLFPREVDVWDRSGRAVHHVASVPLLDNLGVGAVATGPRSLNWRPLQPATLYWAEALDGGNPRNPAQHRDRVMMLAAPFTGAPRELGRTEQRYSGITWTTGDVAFLTSYDRPTRMMRAWIFEPDDANPEFRKALELNTEDAYNDPGDMVEITTPGGQSAALLVGDWVYLDGQGAGPEGDRPFLDRMNVRTLATERIWQSEAGAFETFVALIDDNARRIVTRRETPVDAPNYFLRDVRANRTVALTDFPDPAPQLRGIRKQLVTYEREDGVPLNGTLYLPADYQEGQKLPVVVWAYPREFVDADVAGQVRSSANRFDQMTGASHLFFLTQGYAVFDGPTMPIIGGDTANNSYVEQLVESAEAAIDKIVEMGIADEERIGVGGHSYGAFMTANLLAHSDIFRAGIARSGAYNRTLTPFGFQSEQRTYWEVPELYSRMSPFTYAHQINEPLLMIHGEADNNSGTFPVQSERMYAAIKGHGGTVRLVMLPHESHGYAARESVMHSLAEMIGWFDKYVKNAPTRRPTSD